jgi:hypothetical protein
LAIASALLKAEAGSIFYENPQTGETFDPNRVRQTWYHRFVQILHTGISADDIDTIFDNVSIVTFNYDRCIEHFVARALQDVYHIPPKDAQALTSRLRVIHPYGTIGRLPWQNGDGPTVAFGGERERIYNDLGAMSEQIKTFTERLEEGVLLDAIQNDVQEADAIVFLGFAYYDQNMELLTPKTPSRSRRVLGTVYGVSKSDQEVIREQIATRKITTSGTIHLYEGKCVGLFDEYWRTLTS